MIKAINRIKALKYFRTYEQAAAYLNESCSNEDLINIAQVLNMNIDDKIDTYELIVGIWSKICESKNI